MAKKNTRMTVKYEKLRLRARTLYLESGGVKSLTKIAKELGVSRQTTSKWKAHDNWSGEMEGVKLEVDEKLRETAVANLFDGLQPEYKEVSNNIRVLNNAITDRMWLRDKNGNILRDENGKPRINNVLETKELRDIAQVLATNTKTMRLLTGESTENISQKTKLSGKVDHKHTHETKGVIDDCMDKMKSGEISNKDGQEALTGLAEAFQDFREKVNQ